MTMQLPVFGQDMRALFCKLDGTAKSAGEAGPSLQATRQQLQEALDEARASDEPGAEELAAILASMLQGGVPLPPSEASGGRFLPPAAALTQGFAGHGDSSAGEQITALLESGDALTLASEAGLDQEALLLKLQSEAGMGATQLRQAGFETLMARIESNPLAIAMPAGSAVSPASAGAPFAPVSTIPGQSLLSMPVPQPVTDPAWGAAIGERLVWMARGDQQMAELKVTPPNLGPLEVRLNINHDQASVSFVSNHALVRDAIEAAIPRLREMLAEQSLNLVQAEVGSGRERDAGAAGEGGRDAQQGPGSGEGESAGGEASGSARVLETRAGAGLLDLFA